MSKGTGHLFREMEKLEKRFTPINKKYKGNNPGGESELDTIPEEEYESDTKRLVKW